MLLLLLSVAHAVEPFGGVEWRPLSRADLVWVDDGRTSGTGVGEFDGTARPSLQGYGGAWLSGRTALSLSVGIARLQNTVETEDVLTQTHTGVVRPGIDLRWTLMRRVPQVPLPWLLLGVHGDIPSARDVSNGYTKAEQDVADAQAQAERGRLGGFGARTGIGATYEVLPGLGIGAQWAVEWHQGVWRVDSVGVIGSWVAGDASLLLEFRWPRAEAP